VRGPDVTFRFQRLRKIPAPGVTQRDAGNSICRSSLVVPGFKRSFLHYASITVDALPSALHNHQHHILRDGKHGSVDREFKGKDARRPLQDDSVGSVKEDSLNTLNVYTLPPLVIL
jgi:hypothetical protein